MNDPRYMYVRDRYRNPVGVLVMSRNQDSLEYQYSVAHSDDKFDRVLGKQMALKALSNNPHSITVIDGCDMSGHMVSREIMNHINSYSKNTPTKVVKFARSWLSYNSK